MSENERAIASELNETNEICEMSEQLVSMLRDEAVIIWGEGDGSIYYTTAVNEVNVIDVYEFQDDGSTSDPFLIKSRVKQGCALAPTLFGIIFSLLQSYAFSQSEDGVYLHTRSDGHLFNLPRLRAKTKVRKVLIRELLFADDAALTAHAH